jgi:CO dehydrogenase nickel-insertion accessory protein CooC1
MVTGRGGEGKLTIGALSELQIKSERKVNKL